MTIWKFDMCPQCGGDLYVDQGINGWYERCACCSYHHNLQTTAELAEALTQREKEASPTDEKSYCPSLINCRYISNKEKPLLPSVNLFYLTTQLQAVSIFLN